MSHVCNTIETISIAHGIGPIYNIVTEDLLKDISHSRDAALQTVLSSSLKCSKYTKLIPACARTEQRDAQKAFPPHASPPRPGKAEGGGRAQIDRRSPLATMALSDTIKVLVRK